MAAKPKNWRNIKLFATGGVIFISIFFELLAFDTGLLDLFDLKIYDEKMVLVNQDEKPHEDIVVVAIDDPSLDALENIVGRWPWKRRVFGEMLEFFEKAGAKSVYMDLGFFTYSSPKVDGEMDEDDAILTEGTANFPGTVHSMSIIREPDEDKSEIQHLLHMPIPEDTKMLLLPAAKGAAAEYNRLYLPFDELLSVAQGLGSINITADEDGGYRRITPLRSYMPREQYKVYYFKTLALANQIAVDEKFTYREDLLQTENFSMPLVDGKVLLNLYDDKAFKSYSASIIYTTIQQMDLGVSPENWGIDPKAFKDKEIFVGTTAIGTQDVKKTAFNQLYPGVYLHASLLNSIKKKEFISKLPRWIAILISLFMVSLIAWAIIYQDDVVIKIFGFLILNFLYIVGAIAIFKAKYIWVPSGYILITNLLAFLIAYVYRTFYENKDKRFIKNVFKNYISPQLIEQIHATGELPKLGGNVDTRTAYFTDIASFSTFSEKLEPEELVNVLNEYLTEMTEILLSESGTLDKFVGDAIIAIFGAPHKQEDHAIRACRVAIKMQRKHRDLRAKWQAESYKWPDLVLHMKMRIGINSGDILTGNMGAIGRMNYTMMGDAVNLAARLESSAKQYGILNHISEETLKLTNGEFLVRKLDKIVVKGKTEPVITYELLDYQDCKDENILKLVEIYHEALQAYEKMDFIQALKLFEQAEGFEKYRFDDLEFELNPSKVYIQRCQSFIQTPPAKDWNGVFILTQK